MTKPLGGSRIKCSLTKVEYTSNTDDRAIDSTEGLETEYLSGVITENIY